MNEIVRQPGDIILDAVEPRCAVVLLLDTSGSMVGEPINQLNQALIMFKEELLRDNLTTNRIELALITFNSQVSMVHDFCSPRDFQVPHLGAGGSTKMVDGILLALHSVETRKQFYRAHGIEYYRPWVFMLTDGEPDSDQDINQVADRITELEKRNRCVFTAVGVEGANMTKLRQVSPVRQPMQLKGLRFHELFQWLSASLQAISSSQPGDQIPLPPNDGWKVL